MERDGEDDLGSELFQVGEQPFKTSGHLLPFILFKYACVFC